MWEALWGDSGVSLTVCQEMGRVEKEVRTQEIRRTKNVEKEVKIVKGSYWND